MRAVYLVPLLVTGCASLPPPDCQVRAGTLQGEVGYDAFVQTKGAGGAASLVGDPTSCQNFRVYTRGPNGSEVCYDGVDPNSSWCERERPVTINATRSQLRELLRHNDFETPPPRTDSDDGGS